ncbi:hypothetical protein M422DRAFT_32534 [Sphaerobolus stellatus SS14]|uniref:Unplaced genomic scaffold SPHSTscaffold_73, whole genome shotgun sequence n=1 Tax=Sphaerobolus stellatus (strain SS14) TaxID=990650 RepID=A0A0C9UA15_SPHS4|nr:hypothetical protein M422DRAFT_32534 [Sphaerobolus stellatus SS14]
MTGSRTYIVSLKQTATEEEIAKAEAKVTDSGGRIERRYNSPILKGFSAIIPDSYLSELQSLQGDLLIDNIEADQTVTTQ